MNFGGHGPDETTCTGTMGKSQSFVVKGPRFRTWNGLQVGDGEDLVALLHPSAELRRGDWWLRTAFSPIAGGGEYPVVRASVGPRGRVSALLGWIGAAGE